MKRIVSLSLQCFLIFLDAFLLDVQNGRISANTSVQEKISSLSTDIEEIEDVSIKSKVEPLHCLDEELIIIIDDDDDDDTGMLSQVLAVQEQNVNEQSLSKTDDIFDKIKKELEELDKVDCQEWQYPFTIDSDNENFSEIFEEELKEVIKTFDFIGLYIFYCIISV